jgi:DNA-binding LacI/PurR family transcriptional regulator
MSVTIIDVAKEAHVSKSTVSLVINNDPVVRPETRQRVLDAIERLGYVVNFNARGLSAKKTHLIGVVLMVEGKSPKSYEFDQETEVFGYDVSIGIPLGLEGTDYGLITERFFKADQKSSLPRLAQENRTDGLILIGGLFSDDLIEELVSLQIPVVIIGRTHPLIDSITADYRRGAALGVEHLVETGHRRIAFINCPCGFFSNPHRRQGWEDAVSQSNTHLDGVYTVDADSNTGLGGYTAMATLLEQDGQIDGVVTANDGLALGAMRLLLEQGKNLPQDLSLVSYEDSILSGYATVPVTTVSFDKEQMGKAAARLLVKRITEGDRPPQSITLPVTLNQRSSVRNRIRS